MAVAGEGIAREAAVVSGGGRRLRVAVEVNSLVSDGAGKESRWSVRMQGKLSGGDGGSNNGGRCADIDHNRLW